MFTRVLLAFHSALHDLLAPFALHPALPDSVTGRHSRDYYEATAPPLRPSAGTGLPAVTLAACRTGDRRVVPTFTKTSIGQVGAQLYPDSIATATPQPFTVASPPLELDGFGVG